MDFNKLQKWQKLLSVSIMSLTASISDRKANLAGTRLKPKSGMVEFSVNCRELSRGTSENLYGFTKSIIFHVVKKLCCLSFQSVAG